MSGNANSLIKMLTNKYGSIDTTIPFKYDTDYEVKNNKRYVIWNTFTIMSTCSGERADYTAKEVYENDPNGNFHVNVFADLSPNGSPYFSPVTYLGKPNLWQTAIKGMPWQNQPIAYDRQSGWYINRQSKNLDWNQYVTNEQYNQQLLDQQMKVNDSNYFGQAIQNTASIFSAMKRIFL